MYTIIVFHCDTLLYTMLPDAFCMHIGGWIKWQSGPPSYMYARSWLYAFIKVHMHCSA